MLENNYKLTEILSFDNLKLVLQSCPLKIYLYFLISRRGSLTV